MKILVFICTYLLTFQAFSQNSYQCYITFSFKDCVNCNQPFRTFSKIPSQLNPIVVFRVEDSMFALKYLENQLLVKPRKEQIIFSDSLYKALNGGDAVQSYVHLLWRNKVLVKSSLLKEFSLEQLEPFLAPIEVKAKLPDSLLLASPDFCNSSTHLFVKDHLFQKIYIHSKKEKKIIHTITQESVSNQALYKAYYGDTTGYFNKIGRFKKQLEGLAKFKPSFNSISISKQGELFVEWILNYALPEKNGIGIYGGMVVTKWINKDEFILYKEKDEKNGYRMGGVISVDKENIIADIYHEKDSITANTYFLAQYTRNDKAKEITQKKLCLKFPEFALKSKTDYMYLSGEFCYPYYFFQRENLVGNIETGEYFPLLNQKIENDYVEILKTNISRYSFRDVVKISKDVYRVLYVLDDEHFVADFNPSQKKFLSQKNIAIPKGKKENNLLWGLYLNDTGTKIYAFTKENELLEISF